MTRKDIVTFNKSLTNLNTMTPTNRNSNTLPIKPLSRQIVQLHPIVDEKLEIPERIWNSLKDWKSKLQYWEEECYYLRKMIKWNGIVAVSVQGKDLFIRFEKLVMEEHPRLVSVINDMEKEIIAAIFEGEVEAKNFHIKLQRLEKGLKEFNVELAPIKLEVLKMIANNSPITFF